MADQKPNLTPKTPTPREQAIALLAEQHGITKAHAAGLIDRALRHLKPAAAESTAQIEQGDAGSLEPSPASGDSPAPPSPTSAVSRDTAS